MGLLRVSERQQNMFDLTKAIIPLCPLKCCDDSKGYGSMKGQEKIIPHLVVSLQNS